MTVVTDTEELYVDAALCLYSFGIALALCIVICYVTVEETDVCRVNINVAEEILERRLIKPVPCRMLNGFLDFYSLDASNIPV